MQKYPKDGEITKDFADSCGDTYDVVGINGGETWNDVFEAARVITIWSRELHGASNEEKLEYSKCSIFQTHYLVFIFRYHRNRTVSAAGGWLMGGGLSFTTRHYGIGVDQVVAFQLISENGTSVLADGCSNPGLFWAI
jgi:hypothetical protein